MRKQPSQEDIGSTAPLPEQEPNTLDLEAPGQPGKPDPEDEREEARLNHQDCFQEKAHRLPQDKSMPYPHVVTHSDRQKRQGNNHRKKETPTQDGDLEESTEVGVKAMETVVRPKDHDHLGSSNEHRTKHLEETPKRNRQCRGAARPQSVIYTTQAPPRNNPVCEFPQLTREQQEHYWDHQRENFWLLLHFKEREQNYMAGLEKWDEYGSKMGPLAKNLNVEIQRLRAELQESQRTVEALQKPILRARDRFQPCEDSRFKEMMTTLVGVATSLSRQMKRESILSKSEFKNFMQDNMFTKRVDDLVWSDSSMKKHLMLAAVWHALCETLLRDPFQVYGEAGETAMKAWEVFFGQGGDGMSCSRAPPTHEGAERWRSLTAFQLHESMCREPEKLGALLEQFQSHLLERLQPLSNPKKGTVSWDVKKLVELAANLASTMAQQRCRVELFYPDVVSMRDDDMNSLRQMESVADIGGSPLARPLFLVIPGLRKWGNGWGQNLEESTVMYAANVASDAEEY